jgi:hypothetical protein
MKRSALVAAMAAALAVTAPAFAQQAQPAPAAQPAAPKVMDAAMAGDVTTVTAKIVAVDQATRMVTLQGPSGRTVTMKAGEQVKNLAQVKAGDELVIKYAEAVSLALEKGDMGRMETQTTTAPVAAPAGAKPGVAQASQTVIVAAVQSVDTAKNMVVLQGPNGNYVEVKVKNPALMKDLKAGDKVKATYTEAVMVEVVGPKK